MRSISEIKKEITDAFMSNEAIMEKYDLNSDDTYDKKFSKVSLENILFYTISTSIWILESLFITHQSEVDSTIANMKPHTYSWYSWKSKMFQYGSSLPADSDTYDNSALSSNEIEEQKIVKYASVSSSERRLLIKVAKVVDDDLAPLSLSELTAFSTYIARIKDAGVFTNIISEDAEQLKLSLDIYYNPELMDSEGNYIDGSDSSAVETAIKRHLNTIDFNGELILAKLIDDLQNVRGVEIPHITLSQYKYGLLPWTDFSVFRKPLSGYIRITNSDLSINYIPR